MNTLIPIQNTQHIYDLVGLCADFGVEKAVICPGSRCAPLLIGFWKHPNIKTISITDERSAGFVGLGLAQQSGKPVVLVCTSGTAAQNFAPAVTEAFYQHVPLIVLTADRPPEWIDQWDGQTIHQENLYIDHIKSSYTYDEENVNVAEEALTLALDGVHGPIHLNIPIREPFYPDSPEEIIFPTESQKMQRKALGEISNQIWYEFSELLSSLEKVMVLGGQMAPNNEIVRLLNQLDTPVVGDVISNLHGVEGVLKSADLLFKSADASLVPDFLITIGRSVISSNLKLYLRKHKPQVHWHVGLGMVGDPFQSLTKIVESDPVDFLQGWVNRNILMQNQFKYRHQLNQTLESIELELTSVLKDVEFNYFSAVQKVMDQLPENSILHLGNSMPVRIANIIGINDPSIEIWCNRGTSGIDGVVSTAVGHALANIEKKHTLIIGDLSFFYDRNGLWLNRPFPQNLQIVILNDNGGGIFYMISGPSNQDGLVDLFITPHHRTAEFTANEFGLRNTTARSLEEIPGWKSGIIEIFTEMEMNSKVFNQLISK